MWDVLIEYLALDRPDSLEDARLELAESAAHRAVDEAQLERLRPLVEQALDIRCDFVLIGYGRALDEQEDLLDRLNEVVGGHRALHFDITHGLRHLSMLALVASHLLEVFHRTLSVEEIWYGALEMGDGDGTVPVIQLDGLLRLQSWIEAWRRFEGDGDYSVIADLIESEGGDPGVSAGLRRAAFHEGMLNLADARRCLLNNVLPVLEREPLPGAGRIFSSRLRERLDWVRQDNLFEHQRRLARLHLAKGDFLRAAILANEAVLTRWMVNRSGNVHEQKAREEARQEMLAAMRHANRDAALEDFQLLEALRNALAHGSMPKWKRTRDLMRNPDRLKRDLEQILDRLLGG